MLFDEFNNLLVDVVRLLSHLIIKVSAVERALELLRVGYAQTLLYVHAHLVGGCSRERYDRSCANLVYRRAYVAIFGAEVVTPLRYAVRLVDGVERNLERTEELQVVLFVERLRRPMTIIRFTRSMATAGIMADEISSTQRPSGSAVAQPDRHRAGRYPAPG